MGQPPDNTSPSASTEPKTRQLTLQGGEVPEAVVVAGRIELAHDSSDLDSASVLDTTSPVSL